MLVAPELKLGRAIGLELPLGVVGVSGGSHPSPAYEASSGGSAYFAMPGVRIRPFAGHFVGWGDAPWIAGGGGLANTGGVACPSVDVRAGADLRVGSMALGPFLGFLQIIDVRPGALRNDAHLALFGVHGQLSLRPPAAPPASAPEGDHDGRPDSVDTCQGTIQEDGQCREESTPPPRVAAAMEGEDRFELDHRISFQLNSAVISPAGIQKLHRVAALMQQHREYARLWILGHADELGDDSYNTRLSEERALAVRAMLIQLGVEEARIGVSHFGKHRPRQLEHTLAAHIENRRVEFQIVRRPDVAPLAVESADAKNEGGQR